MVDPERGNFVLVDFGYAIKTNQRLDERTAIGTLAYMAPEQFEKQYTPKTGQYSLAVLAYRLLVGRFPFDISANDGKY